MKTENPTNHSPSHLSSHSLFNEEELQWDNSDNKYFYESIKAEGLKSFAEQGGLTTGCDMQALTFYWSKATSILDVGSGYGRALDYLLTHNYKKNITAIERCEVLFEYLKKTFSSHKNICLLHNDIRYLDNTYKHDLILLLWSTFADFPPAEQQLLLRNLTKLLNKNGNLVIDTMPENVIPLQACEFHRQFYTTKVNEASVHTYEPTTHEIKQYAQNANMIYEDRIICKTDIGRERWLHILTLNN